MAHTQTPIFHRPRGTDNICVALALSVLNCQAGFVQRQWVFDHKSDTILVYHLTLPDEWQLARRLRAPGSVGSFGEIRRYGQSDTDGNFTLVTSTGTMEIE